MDKDVMEMENLAKEIEQLENEMGYDSFIEKEPIQEKPKEEKQVVVKTKKGSSKKAKKANFLSEESSYYQGSEDFDKNEFILEGFISSIYTPENKAVTYVMIMYTGKGRIKNFPQVKVFRSYNKILEGIREKDYVSIKGNIYSQKRTLPDGKPFMESVYVAKSIHKLTPPVPKQDTFFDRFEIGSSRIEKKYNYVLVSGIVSEVRIIGQNASGGIRFKITSHWGKKEEDTIVAIYYPTDIKEALNQIYNTNRIVLEGEIQTRKIIKKGKPPVYSQDVVVKKIGSIRKDR